MVSHYEQEIKQFCVCIRPSIARNACRCSKSVRHRTHNPAACSKNQLATSSKARRTEVTSVTAFDNHSHSWTAARRHSVHTVLVSSAKGHWMNTEIVLLFNNTCHISGWSNVFSSHQPRIILQLDSTAKKYLLAM
jgi:hypothetical protein